jgi:hypothetical protein
LNNCLAKQIEKILYGYNYQVYIFDKTVALNDRLSLQETVCFAVGDQSIIIGAQNETSKLEIIQIISEALSYTGDEVHGSRLDETKSVKFKQLLTHYISDLNSWLDDDNFMLWFWIKENHPGYPVYWEYAFYIENTDKQLCRILIGSSSD